LVTISLYVLLSNLVSEMNLEVFKSLSAADGCYSLGKSSLGVPLPYRVFPSTPVALSSLQCNSSHGVRSPSTLEDIWSPHSQVCLAWFVTLSGFLNLLALCFSRNLLALFHASNALGVQPFRVFPPTPSLDILSVSRAFLSLASQDGLDFKALIRVWVR
jgi:hypothetical protein